MCRAFASLPSHISWLSYSSSVIVVDSGHVEYLRIEDQNSGRVEHRVDGFSFITSHSWFLQIITLGLGASALILVFARLGHARRTDADNQSLLLPVIAICAAAAFIFRFFVLWASSRPARYADYMPEGGAPVTNGIALNSQFFQLTSPGIACTLACGLLRPATDGFSWEHSPGQAGYRQLGGLPRSRIQDSRENSEARRICSSESACPVYFSNCAAA